MRKFAKDSEENKMKNSRQRNSLRVLFILVTIVVTLFNVFGREAHASDYYISPSGSDSNRGDSGLPWKTFKFAIPRLQPGDTLFLKNGTYTTSNSGFPFIDCSTNAKNGTNSQRITIKAENERQAFIKGDGTMEPFDIENCQYWTIEGLHIESADSQTVVSGVGDPLFLGNSSHIIIRRLLLARNNRYRNSHLIEMHDLTDSLFEENELYYFHRHGIALSPSSNNVFRRNYINSRGYPDLVGGRNSGETTRGDTGISIYPGSFNTFENNVIEGNDIAIDIQATNLSTNNRFFGDIGLNNHYGMVFKTREPGDSANNMPQNTWVTNFVSINSDQVGVYFRGNKNARCDNCSVFGGGGGVTADVESAFPGDGKFSVYLTNNLVMNTTGYGFHIAAAYTSSNEYPYSFKNAVSATNTTSVDPALDTCKVFIPEKSPLKRAGKNSSDIGANVLSRYAGGENNTDVVLTSQPLWDPKTGAFPHGAIIPGVNDIPGSSAFDVHKRLNVNTNGCSLPLTNTVTNTVVPSGPRNLQASSR